MIEHRKEYSTRESGDGGLDYRMIADIMTTVGHTMGHSTARNCVNKTMKRFACTLMTSCDITGNPENVARNLSFQKNIEELIHEIYAELST
jgi:hypothetical protein